MFYMDYSLVNGLGKGAVSIYFSGCDKEIKCKNCHNPELWEKQPEKTRENYENVLYYIENVKKLNKNAAVAFLGGEPLAEFNRNELKRLLLIIRQHFPDTDLIVYTWRELEDIPREFIPLADFWVTGEFLEHLYEEGRIPASTNQRIYDTKNKKYIEIGGKIV